MKNLSKILILIISLQFFLACSPTPSVSSGISAYDQKKYQLAISILTRHSDDSTAQFYLFRVYADTLNDSRKLELALEFLKKSANGGYPRAVEMLARYYENGSSLVQKDLDEALRLFTIAAKAGRKSSYAHIANHTVDTAKSEQYYLLAKGTLWGDLMLARQYLVERDHPGAIYYNEAISFQYMKSANSADVKEAEDYSFWNDPKLDLSKYYYYGFGTPKDNLSAFEILQKLNDKNDDEKSFYAWLLFWGHGTEARPVDAVKIWLPILEKALLEHDAKEITFLNSYAYHGLAIAFKDGRGIAVDPARAALFKKENKVLVSDPGTEGTLMSRKYNALGYLNGECDVNDSFLPKIEPMYRSLYAETLVEVSKCMSKSGSLDRIEIYKKLKMAGDLGNIEAQQLALVQWSAMSKNVRSAYLTKMESHNRIKAEMSQLIKSIESGKKDGVRVGMTKQEAIDSQWGAPKTINTTANTSGIHEQWVYSNNNYLYFDNGILTSIQTSKKAD